MEDYLAEILGGAAGAALVKQAYDRLGATGEKAFGLFSGGYIDPETGESAGGLATTLKDMLQFQPYSITTATGAGFGMTEGEGGQASSFGLTLSPEEKLLQDTLLGDAGTLFGKAVTADDVREQEVLNRLRALRAPEEERQRLALEERLAAQGRLGTRTAMFGGTSEQLTLEKAIQEQEARDIIEAMAFAEQQQERQQRMASGLLEAAYVPQGQLLAALEPGMTTAERQREALSEQAQTYGETYSAAIDALLASAIGQADLLGSTGAGLISGASKSLFDIG